MSGIDDNTAKPVKVHFVAPNGKHYEDTIPMKLNEYKEFVNKLLELKTKNS